MPPSSGYYAAKIRKNALELVVCDLVREKEATCSRLPKDALSSAITGLASVGVVISRGALQQRIKREYLERNVLTSHSHDEGPLPQSIQFEEESISSLSSISDQSPRALNVPPQAAGRPHGSSVGNMKKKEKDEKACVAVIAVEYAAKIAEVNRMSGKKRIPKGWLSELIDRKKKEFGVVKRISRKTIETRRRRGRLNPDHRGTSSPMGQAEEALVQICIQMGKFRQPLSVAEAIASANDLIKNTAVGESVVRFQEERRVCSDETVGTLTRGWWRGFLARHSERIGTKRGERFACNRAEWTNARNIKQMYDVIYDEMIDAGIASMLEIPIFTDRNGNEVAEGEKFGEIQAMVITKPAYLLFADESGFNTSQQKDGNVGGTKFVVECATVPQSTSAHTDHRFTMLPFTSASGEAVCCVMIFQSDTEQVPQLWRTGLDHGPGLVRKEDGSIDIEDNLGEGKSYPGGPKCFYNGKTVQCLTYASKSGGISGLILVQILSEFDKIDLFPRVPGLMPMLVIDGHQSRLDPLFIEYVNNARHRWKVCLGVPYATTLWQVGDASEQNGKAKIEWYREKAHLVKWKTQHNFRCSIDPEDIMPLVNKIFHKSYGNVNANLKAVADRGWYPANRKLLDHPSLHTVEDVPPTLNVEDGMGASILDRMIHHRSRSEGARKAAEKRKRTHDSVMANIRDSRRLTAGILTSNGVHSLDDPDFLGPFRQRQKDRAEKLDKSTKGKRDKVLKSVRAVKGLRDKYGHERTHLFAKCSKDECGAYLQYKKGQGGGGTKDVAMPKDLPERIQRCVEWMARPSPCTSPHESDNEEKVPTRRPKVTRWRQYCALHGTMWSVL